MSLFVDTSALYALLVATEADHLAVKQRFAAEAERGRRMVTTNYVVLEATALLQHRIGLDPVRDLDARILPLLNIVFVDAALHRRGVSRLLTLDRRRVSLVDVVSFELMDAESIEEVLGLDDDFTAAGFRVLP